MATALLAGEKLRELILPGAQDDKAGALAALLLQLKLELPFDRVVTIGTVLVPILLVTLVFTKNFAGEAARGRGRKGRARRCQRLARPLSGHLATPSHGDLAVVAAPQESPSRPSHSPIPARVASRWGCLRDLSSQIYCFYLPFAHHEHPCGPVLHKRGERSGVGRGDQEGEWAGSEGRRSGQVETRKGRFSW